MRYALLLRSYEKEQPQIYQTVFENKPDAIKASSEIKRINSMIIVDIVQLVSDQDLN